MARKKKHEEHENHERWLVSYADFITLLFAFFVVMYAVSSVNEGKYRVLSESLVASFRSPSKSLAPIQVGKVAKSPETDQIDFRKTPTPMVIQLPNMPAPRPDDKKEHHAPPPPKPQAKSENKDAAGKAAAAEKELHDISDKIAKAMSSMIRQNLIHVRRSKHWVEVEINTNILFPSGSARLSAPAVPVLEKLARVLKGFPNALHVEGFTDNIPINNEIFPSNWELSAGRAASVVHLFGQAGVDPRRMVAIGYGEYRPVADNATATGRAKNRRVVLVIQSTAGSDKVAKALEVGDTAVPQHTSGPAADETSSAGAGKAEVLEPTNPGGARDEPKFEVIPPPIHLPQLPLGGGSITPFAPPAGTSP